MIFNSQTPRLQEALQSLKWALVTSTKKINAITGAHHDVTQSSIMAFGKPEIKLYIFLIIKKKCSFYGLIFIVKEKEMQR